MKKFFKNRCVLGLLILVLILSIAIGIVNATNPETTFIENVANVIVTPVQKLFTGAGNGISDFFGYFSDVGKLKEENEKLKIQNAELKNRLSKNEIISKENHELRGLLSLKEAYPEMELESSMIISRDPSNWDNSFTIDKGTVDGIAVNQPVISVDKSLVGRISEVGTTWAKVITLNDPEHSAGAEVSRTGEFGIVEGDSELALIGRCKLSYISKNANIVAGDTVMTTGLGGIYPKGLSIGKVEEIRPDTQGISQYAVITPMSDLKNLRTVCVIKNPTGN